MPVVNDVFIEHMSTVTSQHELIIKKILGLQKCIIREIVMMKSDDSTTNDRTSFVHHRDP